MEVIAKDVLVHGRKLKVQRLVIPFTIVGHATSTSVTHTVDEPGVLFLKTEGVDNITAVIESDETAPTFGDSPSDANGVFNALLKIGEQVSKVCSVRLSRRGATIATAAAQVASLGTSTGIVVLAAGGNSDKIALSCDCTVALNSGNTADLCLEVEYIVS
jgi:hypothetical protein